MAQQIIELANSDGIIISHEAFIVLKKEFAKRKLDPGLINGIESQRLGLKKEKILNNMEKEEETINQKIWTYICQQKYENQPDGEIIQNLVNKGFSMEDSTNAVNNLEMIVTKSLKESSNKLFKGLVFIGVASLIAYVSYTYWNNWLWVLLPVIFIVRLIKPFLHFWERYEKNNVILQNIRDSKTSVSTDVTTTRDRPVE